MTIDNRPAPTDASHTDYASSAIWQDGKIHHLEAQPVAIEPRTRVMLEALRRAFLMAAHAIGDYLGMERK